MAEAFARERGGNRFVVMSAGSQPSGQINPRAVRFMAERGIDLSTQKSKSLEEIRGKLFDVVVTMGCGDACPWIAATQRLDWALPDPKNLSDAEFRCIRDQIDQRVIDLLHDLDNDEENTHE
jgi:arsenate reductase (thioredoxin)